MNGAVYLILVLLIEILEAMLLSVKVCELSVNVNECIYTYHFMYNIYIWISYPVACDVMFL